MGGADHHQDGERTVACSSAPSVSLAYLGATGQLLSKVTVRTAPLTSGGFATLDKTFSVPAGVASVRIVLTGFSPTVTRTRAR